MSSEETIRNLEKKHTKRATGSIHQTELKQRSFLNELMKRCKPKEPNKFSSEVKQRMRLQRIMQDNSTLNAGHFHGSVFNVEGFIASFEKEFEIIP